MDTPPLKTTTGPPSASAPALSINPAEHYWQFGAIFVPSSPRRLRAAANRNPTFTTKDTKSTKENSPIDSDQNFVLFVLFVVNVFRGQGTAAKDAKSAAGSERRVQNSSLRP
jgi:hypothetical protein